MVENKRVLVTGGTGYIMSLVCESLRCDGMNIVTPSHKELDFTDIEAVRRYVKKTGCQVFVHAGAYTNVPKAKEQFELVKKINGLGTENVARVCEEEKAKMILLSSDFVFSGNSKNPGPYTEDARRPESFTSVDLGYYGGSKLLAEFLGQKYCQNLAIMRLSYPLGLWDEKDYVYKLMKTVAAGYGLFTDQVVTPTYLPDFAFALSKVIEQDETGIFHVACTNSASPYEIGRYAATYLETDCEIKQSSCSDYLRRPNVDVIPQFGGLDTKLTRERLEVEFHTWQSALDEYLNVV